MRHTEISHDEHGNRAECLVCGVETLGRALVQLPVEVQPRTLACCRDCSSNGEALESQAYAERATGNHYAGGESEETR